MPSLQKRAAHAVWWSTLELAARYAVQFAVMVILAHLLSPEDFGMIAMLVVFTSIGALIADSGFATALIQSQTPSTDDETTVFVFSLCVAILIAVVIFFSAPAIADFFHQPMLLSLTRSSALVTPLGAIGAVPDAVLTMRLDFKSRARAEVLASLISGLLALLLAWSGFGVWSLVWQSILAAGIRSGLLWIYSGWRPCGVFRLDCLRRLFSFGAYMLLSGLLNTVATRLQSLMIGKLFDSRSLGYYTLAQNTQSAPASFMGSVLNRVGLPVFSTVSHDRVKLLNALRNSLQMAMFLFVPCMIGLALIAKPLIALLYGDRWIAAAPILSILAASASLWPLHVLNLAAISAQGRSDLFFRLEVVKQAAAIVLILFSSPFGPIAIAWSVFASGVVGVVVNTYYSKILLSYGISSQLADQTTTFTLSLVAGAVGWMILHWRQPSVGSILFSIVASASVYAVLALLSGSSALRGLLSVVRTLRTTEEDGCS